MGVIKHGMEGTLTYGVWANMLYRCNTPTAHNYWRYGAKGVKVCSRWLKFENFLADMGVKPVDKSLDRYPDRHGNYEPSNCRWATATEQSLNRCSTVLLTFGDKTQSIAEWADQVGIRRATLYKRLSRGWSVEKALGMFDKPADI